MTTATSSSGSVSLRALLRLSERHPFSSFKPTACLTIIERVTLSLATQLLPHELKLLSALSKGISMLKKKRGIEFSRGQWLSEPGTQEIGEQLLMKGAEQPEKIC